MDEVINMGDAAFIRSAERRLEQFMAEVSIVVIASHSMDTLREMCQRGVVLNHGAVHFDGPIHNAIHSYEELSRTT